MTLNLPVKISPPYDVIRRCGSKMRRRQAEGCDIIAVVFCSMCSVILGSKLVDKLSYLSQGPAPSRICRNPGTPCKKGDADFVIDYPVFLTEICA